MLALTKHDVKAGSTVFVRAIIFLTLIISFSILDSFYLKLPIVQSIFSTSQIIDRQTCEMSWSRPSYIEVQHKVDSPFSKKYTLYLYREGYVDSDQLQGIPALFIPGQAGSYKQVRSLAAETAIYYHERYNNDHSSTRTLDYFTVDLNEELSALNGQTILDQAEYMNAVTQCILKFYENSPQNPSSVLIVGHSMGGLVARMMFMSPNYVPGTINTIITLASPHLKAPLLLDPLIYKTYKKLTEFWILDRFERDPLLKDVSIISISGGFLDTIVDSNGANLESLVPKTHGFSVISSSIPFVWTGCDHMAILWCNQLVKVIAKSLVEITDVSTSAQTKPLPDRIETFKRYLINGLEPSIQNHLDSIQTFEKHLLSPGLPINYSLDKPTKPSLLLMEQFNASAFITNIPISLDNRWSIVICNGSNIEKTDCKTTAIDVTVLPSAIADKPITADPFRLISLNNALLRENEYIGIINKGGPAIRPSFILADSHTNVNEYGINIWDLVTGNIKFNASGYYSQHVIKNEISNVLAYSLRITGMEAKEVRFKPLLRTIVGSNDSQYYRKLENGTSIRVTFYKAVSEELVLNFITDDQYFEFTLQIDWYGTLGRIVLGYSGIVLPFLYSNAMIISFSQLFTYLINGKSNYISFNTAFISCIKGPFFLILNLLVIVSTLQVVSNYFGLWSDNALVYFLQHDILLGCDDIALPAIVAFTYLLCIGILSIIWLIVSFFIYIISIPLQQFTGPRVKSEENNLRLLSVHLAITIVVVQFIPVAAIFIFYYILWLVMTASVRTKSDIPAIRNTYNFRQSWLIFLTSLLPYYIPSFIVYLKNILLGWTAFNVSVDELVQSIPIFCLLICLVTVLKTPDVFQLRWIKLTIILLNCGILYQLFFGFAHPFLLSALI